jgi:ABC-type histidine transport system ATPase subunit
MNFARDVAHRVAYLERGVLLELGTPEQVINNPRHESTRAFLERVR